MTKSVSPPWVVGAFALSLTVAGCATYETPRGTGADVVKPTTAAQPGAATALPVQTERVVHTLPEPTAMETQHGVQLAQVGLTAGGGLVDVRFKVLDAGKARVLLGNAANMPVLIAGDSPPLMPPHHALKGARFGAGQVFFILYPNQRNAVRVGVNVTVAVGDVRLGPVKAQ
jgi:hypothetical protein